MSETDVDPRIDHKARHVARKSMSRASKKKTLSKRQGRSHSTVVVETSSLQFLQRLGHTGYVDVVRSAGLNTWWQCKS